MTSFSLGQSGLVFQPGMKLKIIVHSCQLSNPTVAQVSFGIGIFRCENVVFNQNGERVSPRFHWNAFGTRSKCERSVRLFLSSILSVQNKQAKSCHIILQGLALILNINSLIFRNWKMLFHFWRIYKLSRIL